MIILITTIFSWNWIVGTSPGGQIINSNDGFREFEPSTNWFLEKKDNNLFISDHYTGGIYSVIAANHNKIIIRDKDYSFYYPSSYTALVDLNNSTGSNLFKNKYILINNKYANKKIWSGGWKDFEPLYKHLTAIDSNNKINKVYNDGYISIFRG